MSIHNRKNTLWYIHTVDQHLVGCGGKNHGPLPPPQNVHILIPGTCEYVMLQSKRDFADVIKLRLLRWDEYPGLSRWAHCNHRDPYK